MISMSVCLSVCLSASISLEPLDQSSRNSLCRSPVAVAGSSSGDVVICCILLVLWMSITDNEQTSGFGRNGPYGNACKFLTFGHSGAQL